jgi:rod shape-determining protein MreC
LLLLAVVSIVMMTLDHRYQATESLRSLLNSVAYPLRAITDLPNELGDMASTTFVSRGSLQEENQTLQIQNELLKAKLQKYTALEAENTQLRKLLKSVQENQNELNRAIVAEILSTDLDPFRRQVVLSKGSDDDVYVGQPIISAEGVMGQVIQVSAFSSIAMLITDPSHALPVQVNRNGVRAIATGEPHKNQLKLLHQPNNTDIVVGDELVTSGLGCVFPSGYPVGKVIDVNINPSLPFAQITVEPSALLDRHRQVLLVWPDTKHLGGKSGCAGLLSKELHK